MAVPLTLKVFKGDRLVASKDFERDIIKIGRLSSAHLCLEDEKVSRIHSVIETAPDGALSIIDMGSVEGTYVNGKRVHKGALTFGDEIRVGGTTIRLERPAAPVKANLQPGEATVGAVGVPAAPGAPVADARKGLAKRVRAERRRGSGPMGLGLRLYWGDQMLASHFLEPGKTAVFKVGSAAGVDFIMGERLLGAPSFEAIRADAQGYTVRFTGKMAGRLLRGESATELKALVESGKAIHDGDAYALPMDGDGLVQVELGDVTLEAFLQAPPKKLVVPFMETVDFSFLNLLLLLLLVSSFFVVTASTRDEQTAGSVEELSTHKARLAKLILKPPEVQKNPLLQRLQQQKEARAQAARNKGKAGKSGSTHEDAIERAVRTAPQGKRDNKEVARQMVAGLFGGKGSASLLGGKNGIGGQLQQALGSLRGSAMGVQAGFGGLGLRGTGSGGGGTGEVAVIGGIGTRGKGGGDASYGAGTGRLEGKKSVDVAITASEPLVTGSLDPSLIRQVIQMNRGQIKFCYESQLTRNPNLAGTVKVRFTITPGGTVSQSVVENSSANSPELESCIADRVRTWIFPKPKGGGVVIVKYPFIFKAAGD